MNHKSSESDISYVLEVQERLAKMADLTKENLGKAQLTQKRWYDTHARDREFRVGDHVLVLLPTSSSKLYAKWQGPYPILRKIGTVNYEVNMFEHVQKKKILYVNMLKPSSSPISTNLWAEEEDDPRESDDVLLWTNSLEESANKGQ